MPRPPKHTPPKDEVPSGGRSGENLNVWISPALAEALRAHVEKVRPRTSKTAVVEEAIEAYLTARGDWPPPSAKGGK